MVVISFKRIKRTKGRALARLAVHIRGVELFDVMDIRKQMS
jgi:hypothetical protein